MTPKTSTRSDARRNHSALLAAGQEAFRSHGLDASMDDVAALAGVGKGTVYRHFPTKDHLIAAILQEHFDDLAERAAALLAATEAGEIDVADAVDDWLREFDKGPSHVPGLHEGLAALMTGESSAVATACGPMKIGFKHLLTAAQEAGLVHQELDSSDVIRLVGALPHAGRHPNAASPLLAVVLRGIKTENARR